MAWTGDCSHLKKGKSVEQVHKGVNAYLVGEKYPYGSREGMEQGILGNYLNMDLDYLKFNMTDYVRGF